MKTKHLVIALIVCLGAAIIMAGRLWTNNPLHRDEAGAKSSPEQTNGLQALSVQIKREETETTSTSVSSQSAQYLRVPMFMQEITQTNSEGVFKIIDPVSGQYAVLRPETKEVSLLDRSGSVIWQTNISAFAGTSKIFSVTASRTTIDVRLSKGETTIITLDKKTGQVGLVVY